jgi:hypothetical protein
MTLTVVMLFFILAFANEPHRSVARNNRGKYIRLVNPPLLGFTNTLAVTNPANKKTTTVTSSADENKIKVGREPCPDPLYLSRLTSSLVELFTPDQEDMSSNSLAGRIWQPC